MLVYSIFMDEDGFTLVKGGGGGADRPRSERLKGLLSSTHHMGLVQLVLPALQPDLSPPL